MKCIICGSEEFATMNGRPKAKCSKCGSFERTRLAALMIKKFNLVNKKSRILHIAPEEGLAMSLYNIAGDNCTFVDLNPKLYSFAPNIKKFDLCHDLDELPSSSFDLIIHSHVLEHLPCNFTYVLYHFDRILSQNGSMLFSIPILNGSYDCTTDPKLTDRERTDRFGQFDHVRKFGKDDFQMFLGKVYALDDSYDVTKMFSEEELIEANIPEVFWKGYTSTSVIHVKKGDYLLGGA